MQRKKLYVTVEITIESDKEITEDTLQIVSSEMDYNFSYDQDGVKIVPHFTEIIESSETLNQ
jgi:nitric oxide synthase oxygenase domain/subunit